MNRSNVLIACRIFQDELTPLVQDRDNLTIIWVDTALHADLPRLKRNLNEHLLDIQPPEGHARILFGKGCHPDINEICDRHCARLPSTMNCIEAFLGDKVKEREKNSTMILTPSWVRTWPDIMKAMGWDEVDVRINLGRYDRILVIDSGNNSLTDEEILAFFDLVRVPVEVEPLDLDHFKRVISDLLE